MSTPSKVGEKIYLLIGVRTLALLRSRHKNPPIYIGLVHDKFCLMLYDRWGTFQPMGGGHPPNAGPDSAIALSQAPYFGNAHALTLGLYPTQNGTMVPCRFSLNWPFLVFDPRLKARSPIYDAQPIGLLYFIGPYLHFGASSKVALKEARQFGRFLLCEMK